MFVDSNIGTRAIGAEALRFEPSEFNADPNSVTALGEAGEGIASLQAIATVAHTATAALFH
jgi:hypothetical protein